MSNAATAFAAAKFASKTKARSATKRQQRIEARKQKIEKIQSDLNEAKTPFFIGGSRFLFKI